MKNTISSILIIVFFVIASTSLNAQSTITWTKDLLLKWSDFKALPDTEILAYAQTSYKIEITPSDVSVDQNNNIQNYKSLNVIANFYTNHSWVFKKDVNLLKHEQLHFDIAGLYAHKIKLEFKKLQENNIADFDAYMSAYKILWAECRALQKQYDSETNHGLITTENNRWIEAIAGQINPI